MKSTFSVIDYLKRQVVKKDGTVPVLSLIHIYNQQKKLYEENLIAKEEFLKAKEDFELASKKYDLVVERLRQDSISRDVYKRQVLNQAYQKRNV